MTFQEVKEHGPGVYRTKKGYAKITSINDTNWGIEGIYNGKNESWDELTIYDKTLDVARTGLFTSHDEYEKHKEIIEFLPEEDYPEWYI